MRSGWLTSSRFRAADDRRERCDGYLRAAAVAHPFNLDHLNDSFSACSAERRLRPSRGEASLPQILAVSPGEPFDPRTWSGSSRLLLTELSRRGAIQGAVNGRFGLADYLERIAAFSPRRDRWRQRVQTASSPVSPVVRQLRSAWVSRRIRTINPRPEVLLQIGAWYDFSRFQGLASGLRCSYHDANVAVYLRRPDVQVDVSSRGRRALDLERRVYDGLDLILTMSDWLRDSFIDDFAKDPADVVTIGAGANLDEAPEITRPQLDRSRLLFVGKQFERKGGRVLLRAFREVHARRPDTVLWIVGPEPQDPQPGVVWLGHVSRETGAGNTEIDRLYTDATTFVMPSLFEPFGVAFLEAMAYGLPCIGAQSCAMPEIIDHGRTGFVVPQGDADALAEALLFLIEHPEQAREMGDAGRRRFREHYTWSAVAERLIAAVATAIERRSGRRLA